MNATIWKFKLQPHDSQILHIKGLIKVLSVAEQYGGIVLYALIDPSHETPTKVPIYVVGTGHDFEWDLARRFLGTVLLMGGRLMFHVFMGEDR